MHAIFKKDMYHGFLFCNKTIVGNFDTKRKAVLTKDMYDEFLAHCLWLDSIDVTISNGWTLIYKSEE